MKNTIFFLVLMATLKAPAVSWKVFGPCSNQPVAQGEFPADLSKSVGQISLEVFEKNKIPYIGVAEGFNSIMGTPVGLDSIEIVSDAEMRAYGWCFSVNGKVPVGMPHEVKFDLQKDQLIWFYAYSTNIKNEWQSDYCSPAYQIKAKQFCGK